MIKNLPASAEDLRGAGSLPGLGRSSGGRNGSSLQYFCLENSHGQSVRLGEPHSEKDTQGQPLVD